MLAGFFRMEVFPGVPIMTAFFVFPLHQLHPHTCVTPTAVFTELCMFFLQTTSTRATSSAETSLRVQARNADDHTLAPAEISAARHHPVVFDITFHALAVVPGSLILFHTAV